MREFMDKTGPHVSQGVATANSGLTREENLKKISAAAMGKDKQEIDPSRQAAQCTKYTTEYQTIVFAICTTRGRKRLF